MKRKEEILAECIDAVREGRSSIEECSRRHPELSGELKMMLEIVRGIKPAAASPSPEFRQRLRNHLLVSSQVKNAAKNAQHGWFVSLMSARAVASSVIAFVVLAGGAGSVYASQSSLPGDVLYPVKIGVEKMQVAVTTDPEQKANLYLQQAQRRVDEVETEVSLNRTPSASTLAAVPRNTDAALREIEKVPPSRTGAMLSQFAAITADQQITLGTIADSNNRTANSMQQTINTLQNANVIADAAYNNTAFLNTKPSVNDNLDKGRFQVAGTLLSVSGQTWNVGGVVLTNVNYSGNVPAVNSQLKIDAINKNDEVFIIDLEITASPQPSVTVKGQFNGTDNTGKVWYVGDTPIAAPEGQTPPANGKNLQVTGVTSNNSLSVNSVQESGDHGKDDGQQTQLEGKLFSVDAARKTLVIKVAGASISVDISSANIFGTNGKVISLSDLASYTGKRVTLDGVSKNGVINSAKEVHLETD